MLLTMTNLKVTLQDASPDLAASRPAQYQQSVSKLEEATCWKSVCG